MTITKYGLAGWWRVKRAHFRRWRRRTFAKKGLANQLAYTWKRNKRRGR